MIFTRLKIIKETKVPYRTVPPIRNSANEIHSLGVYFKNMVFKNRKEAGILLSKKIGAEGVEKPYVFALPRGGVAVGKEVASALSAPLDVIVSRKLGVPSNPELAFGAIAPNEIEYVDWDFAERIGLGPFEIEEVIKKEKRELKRREKLYRGVRKYPDLSGKTVLLVDDGIATGATIIAAIEFLRTLSPKAVYVAAPASAHDSAENIRTLADKVISLVETDDFYAVGQFYLNFPQTTDKEVLAILKKDSK